MNPEYYDIVLSVVALLYVSFNVLNRGRFSNDAYFNSRFCAIFKEDAFSGSFLMLCDAAFSSVQGPWTFFIGR
jgi:hypothetical protein